MLSGNTLSMYIHNNEATRKQRPQTANCQLTSSLPKNDHVQLKGCIFIMANFRNTCPPASSALCNSAKGNILYIDVICQSPFVFNTIAVEFMVGSGFFPICWRIRLKSSVLSS